MVATPPEGVSINLKSTVLTFRSGQERPRNAKEAQLSSEPFKPQTKIAADDILFFYFYLSKKIRLDFSCESSA